MKIEAVGEKLVLQRTVEEKTPLKQRLSRVEGQVRGLKQMIEDNRYCGDAVQQINAVIAAMREVAIMLISQQLVGQVEQIGTQSNAADNGRPMESLSEFINIIRSAYRLQLTTA